MRRIYVATEHFRAPYASDNISFAGLGQPPWPSGRSYWSTHFFRAPYQAGYYQSGALRGVGDSASMTGAQQATVGVLIVGAIILGVLGDKLMKRA